MPVYMEVTRIFSFDAAHRLEDYVGKCNNLHGHTYRLELTVRGTPDHRGIVLDFGDLKRIFKEHYEPILDHKYLNESLPMVNTTAENLSIWFFDHWEAAVRPLHPDVTPVRLRIWETENAFVTLTYEDWRAGRADQ
ncbi:MAG TPA: 6-carboxytetrahydropterin synthase QueD [Symbiobacteriaceae bacterium]|jgi:6-pyruvoyltetrahydropterin/6-carboxytetrahydropterin synthase|nr:6-carboxytetrahydropterin synthase QueD [Symbiobacteriaceae bacterium]